MRVGYVAPGYSSWTEDFPGGIKKVQGQMAALRRAGFEVELLTVDADKKRPTGMGKRVLSVAKGFSWSSVDANRFDALYIRRPGFTRKGFLRYLRDAKRRNCDLRILYEVPTYPYDKEYTTLPHRMVLAIDRANRKKLSRYVDKIVDLSGHDEIFGIPTIQMINGIDMDSVCPRQPSEWGQEVNVMCAASFEAWHGIDRLIEGMRLYVADGGDARRIKVHLLGDGPERRRLQAAASEYGLAGSIRFYGMCGEDEVDEVYDRCDFAIASLGLHRIGLDVASTLKTREYLAKGMPFVYSGEVDVFNEDPVDFCLQVPADESPLDMAGLIAFRDSLYGQEAEACVIGRIRAYAEAHVSVDMAMKNVVDYLKEDGECAHEQ